MHPSSSQYAAALYSLVLEKERARYQESLKQLASLFAKEPKLFRVLCSYSISNDEKEQLLESIWKEEDLKHLLPFLKLLVCKHRIAQFEEIRSCFNELCNESFGIKEGIVYSAAPLSETQIQAIEEALGKKLHAKVALTNSVDHTLLGGAKVALDGRVYDGTLRSRLLSMRTQLKSGGKA